MNEILIIYFFVLVTGACIGSFLNVVALRAISGESIVFPASKCPKCNAPIKWYDNLPILSYFLTFRGKCRSCGEKVSIQYPIVEAITAILFLAIFIAFGISIKTLLLLILVCISIVITITDLKEESVFDMHSWIFIITAVIFSCIQKNVIAAFAGLIGAAIFMEFIARATYFLIKRAEVVNETKENEQKEEIEKPTFKMDKFLYPIISVFTAISVIISALTIGASPITVSAFIVNVAALIISINDIKKEFTLSFFGIAITISALSVYICLKCIHNFPLLIAFCILTILTIKLAAYIFNKITQKLGTVVNEIKQEEETTNLVADEEINEYVMTNKRAFGEGDTYLAAASGALVGWGFIIVFFLAIIIGVIPVIPQILKNILNQKRHLMILSVSALIIALVLLRTLVHSEFSSYSIMIISVIFALDFLTGLKKMKTNEVYTSLPFGPSLIIATFLVLFFAPPIIKYLLNGM